MKTMSRPWWRVLVVACLWMLSSCTPTNKPPEPPEETKKSYLELLRMGQSDDSFEGALVELDSGEVLHEQDGHGQEELAKYRKVIEALAPKDQRIQFVLPRGIPQADPVPPPKPTCAQGDESVWVRFALQLTSDYLGMERELSEQLKEQVNFVEIVEIDPVTHMFTANVVDSNTREIIYKATGDEASFPGYEEKLENIAPQSRRVRTFISLSEGTGQQVIPIGPPPPPGPVGHKWSKLRLILRTIHGLNSALSEQRIEAQRQK